MSLAAHTPQPHFEQPSIPGLRVVPPLPLTLRNVETLPANGRHALEATARALGTLMRSGSFRTFTPAEQARLGQEGTEFTLTATGVLVPDQKPAFARLYPELKEEAESLSDHDLSVLSESIDLPERRIPHPAMVVMDHFRRLSRETEPGHTMQGVAALAIERYTPPTN